MSEFNNISEKQKAFKAELKELLKKYNALIGFSVSDNSDTYGLNDEKIVVEFRPSATNEKCTITKLSSGYWVSKQDL